MSPHDRLFRGNDIAIMTRAMIKCHINYAAGLKSTVHSPDVSEVQLAGA